MTQITIARRFNGPVASGNGGYAAGLAAQHLNAPAAEVTLRAAIPLDTPLLARPTDTGLDILHNDGGADTLILSARAAELDRPTIASPGLDAARAAATHYRNADDHVLPTCFVCGPARATGDGLRIFTDWVAPEANPNAFPIVAAPWTPDAGLVADDGLIAPEFLWAALDCPGAFAIDVEPILLGRISAQILQRPPADAPLIAVAWKAGAERRKHFAGSALFTESGALLAFSQQTWIKIDAHAHAKAD